MPPSSAELSERSSRLEQSLLECVRENLLPELPADFAPDADLFAEGLDSMAIMQLVLLLDDSFGFKAAPADLTRKNFGSARALAQLILSRAGSHSS